MHDSSNNSRVLTEQEYFDMNNSPDKKSDPAAEDYCSVKAEAIRHKPNISAAVTNIKEYLSGKGTEERIIQRIKLPQYKVTIRDDVTLQGSVATWNS